LIDLKDYLPYTIIFLYSRNKISFDFILKDISFKEKILFKPQYIKKDLLI